MNWIIDINNKNLNLVSLDDRLLQFLQMYQQRPYLFMNSETLIHLEDQTRAPQDEACGVKLKEDKKINQTFCICEYHGYKVYCNDDMKFGEVELR